jgi:hypothetical protein
MGVAHTLSRTFFWSENILWKEDLFEHHTTVFLGGKDSIINASLVRAYLQGAGEHQTGKDSNQSEANTAEEIVPCGQVHGRLNVVWCADLDHGQIFDLPVWRTRLEIEVLTLAARAA